MLSINTNLSTLITQNSLKNSTSILNQAVERMTTGYKINHAKDNAANYSISTNMTTKIGAYMVAEDNCAMGLDMLTTANGTLDQISDKLARLRALAEQASNGTYGQQSLKAINAEANALVDEINRLYSTAEYNGKKLFHAEETLAVATYANTRTTEKKFINDVVQRDTSGMTKLSTVDETQILASGTYSISTADELAKLATMTNTGKLFDTENLVAYGTYEFVLANDIDLVGYGNWTPIGNIAAGDVNGDGVIDDNDTGFFTGTFDGNGYAIKNMTMIDLEPNYDSSENFYMGLFVCSYSATIKNLGVEDINIVNSGAYAAGIIVSASYTNIENVYTTGNINGGSIACGISGIAQLSTITDSYSTATLSANGLEGTDFVFGISYNCIAPNGYSGVSNCFFAGAIEGTFDVDNGKALSPIELPNSISNNNNYCVDTWTTEENKQAFGELLIANGMDNLYIDKVKTIQELEAMYGITLPKPANLKPADAISFQIGIHSRESSSISLEIGFALDGVNELYGIGLESTTDYLSKIDNLLSVVSSKATEYGAAQNRLESALDEISTQYENLVSSRSTIRDADIAKESASYIQAQILQQASATLLATANQSPSIALQLI